MTLYEQAIVDSGIQLDPVLGGYRSYDIKVQRGVDHRRPLVEKFSWAIPSEEALGAVVKHSPILEVGAGSGYWARELASRGADVVATDLELPGTKGGRRYKFKKVWYPVERVSAADAVRMHPSRVLLLVWPSYDESWAAEALEVFGGDCVIYVGEGRGGCTADERFYDVLEARFRLVKTVHIPQWASIHDCLKVYRRINHR